MLQSDAIVGSSNGGNSRKQQESSIVAFLPKNRWNDLDLTLGFRSRVVFVYLILGVLLRLTCRRKVTLK